MRLAFVFCTLGVLATAAHADTVISGGQIINATWTTSGSPYVIQGDIVVPTGSTLTIEAGVVVQAASGSDLAGAGRNTSRVEIDIAGTLNVQGTAQSPVTFRSASTTNGSWYGLIATGGGSVNVAHANIQHAMYGFTSEATAGTVQLANVTAQSCSSYGFWLRGGTLSSLTALTAYSNGSYGFYVSDSADVVLQRSVIRNNGSAGIYIAHNTAGHSVSVANTTLNANGTYGIYSNSSTGNGATITVKNSIITNSSYGLYRSDSAAWNVTHTNVWNNTSGNYISVTAGTKTLSSNPLYVGANDLRLTSNSPSRFGGDDNLDQGALPYDTVLTPGLYGVLWSNTTLLASTGSYTSAGDLTVAPGVTLTIEPGVTLSFTSSSDIMASNSNTSRGELIVRGTLVANGTPTNKITITSTSTSNGSWYGIDLDTTATSTVLDDLNVRYAMYGIQYRSAASGNTFANITVENSSSYGFWLRAGSPALDLVTAISNGSYGYYISDSASPTFTRCIARNNGSAGMYIAHNTSGQSVSLTRCTLNANGTYGIYSNSSTGNGATINVVGSIITNSSYGVYRSDSAAWSVTSSNVWNNTSGNYISVTAGTGTISSNPLYVGANDLRLTSNSPSRFGAPGNVDQGALPYDTVITPGLYGVLWSNTTLTAAMGPYTAAGDVTVAAGVSLTIEPGAVVSFTSSSDIMAANSNTSRAELIVLGTLVADGTPQSPITLSSTSTTNGSWYGVDLGPTATSTVLDNVNIRYAMYGLQYRSTGAGNVLTRIKVENSSSYGAWLRAGSPSVDALSAISNGSYGVYVSDAASPTLTNCVLRNNGSAGMYIAHNTSGQSVTVTNCTLNANGTYGIYSNSSTGNGATINVKNSIVTNSSYGLYRSDSAGWTVTYSNVWNNTSGNYISVSGGTGTLSTNPFYVGATDLHLTNTSPAIDAGTTGPSGDADGVARPLDGNGIGGAQYDMGAYEYVLSVQCGNGAVESGETCDDGNNNGTYGYCNSSCNGMGPRCGDSVMNGPEQCDDGNSANTDECLNACIHPRCGDGYVRINVEQCDDANMSNTDACLNTCSAASCGDGHVRAGMEACDDGNQTETDACLTTCVAATCGDGHTQAGVEDCDDANMTNTDACLNVCKGASCGDGFAQTGVEGCDDGNMVETDTCTSMCVSTTCGDGVLQSEVEQCDDGNKIDSDACRSSCVNAACGDGAIQFGVEECDDGNTDAGDGCDELCIVEGDEMPPGGREGPGCCQSSRDGAPGSVLLAIAVLFGVRRRRYRR